MTDIPAEIVETRNALAARLAAAGFTEVVLCFSGCGDSGQLNDIGTNPELPLDPTLYSDLSNFGDDYLEATDVNWYDGDGGGGTLTFDLANKTFSSDVYWNETVTNTGFAENDPLPIGDFDAVAKATATSVQP
ncbi:hypothetical protein K9U39_19775 [Rhodoblastus acidophilus]|uniref:DUF6878 domain-containing protein n=1 Tax=Candidatus Rhodoblastus alkanivorans TaxID=2954117 RepID=A0ABS9ZBQ7_9HYPH|nr:DUF6878 family protein [Candidatus Rhodoblastus alkanivorans]MCI4680801.1 hypothetical protein [Candidatus Rhodoblastus alkanivorans]MCI4684920.1 hypothetical protein [Candidatus Rhodoblastus alkanivorans]MDI4643135.1 hypothetical protein [Rhodoblastus acidophilus]